jgi:uncharacterized cofD-like protein
VTKDVAMDAVKEKKRLRIAVIGGGTGSYTALSGLKNHLVDLTAIVSMADDGGSTGRLRDEFGQLPPGDVRRCLIGLSSHSSVVLRRLFEYRFDRGNGLEGHCFGNLFLTALTEITGRSDLAIAEAARLLGTRGDVLPVTLSDSRLCAELEDGTHIRGETHIDIRGGGPTSRIKRVYLDPPSIANPAAMAALQEADAIVIGPGDLYTSVLPNLLVTGIAPAIRQAAATRIYVCNVMTKHGETDGFRASDFVAEVQHYLGGLRALDHVLLNDPATLPEDVLGRYARENALPVEPDTDRCRQLGVEPHVRRLASTTNLVRHDSAALANAILKLVRRPVADQVLANVVLTNRVASGEVRSVRRDVIPVGRLAAAYQKQ